MTVKRTEQSLYPKRSYILVTQELNENSSETPYLKLRGKMDVLHPPGHDSVAYIFIEMRIILQINEKNQLYSQNPQLLVE